MSHDYEIVVLGGGPGGYVAAIRASQLGFKTAVIEKDKMGGICLNWGCIPTKSLLKNAEVYDIMKNKASDFGIKVDGLSFDFDKIIKRSRDVSTKISRGVDYLIKKNNITRIKGFGKLTSAREIQVFDDEGNISDKIIFHKLIIATGARPKTVPAIPVDHEKIITSKEAMSLNKLPGSLIVVGAGAIGVEFAYFYNVLGTKVSIVEMLDNILPIEDSEVSRVLEASFKKRGIEIYTGTAVESAEAGDSSVKVKITKGGKSIELEAEKVLNAIGVTGNVEGIGIEEIGIELERGWIKVDANYKTNIDGIYAIGDVNGPPWLAHVASAEGIKCVEGIKGLNPVPLDINSIPGCTYCQPQVASIGLTEDKARAEGHELKIGKFPFSASGKAGAIGEKEGFVKLIFDANYGELLGAHIIGSEATELIAELGIAKSMEATYESLLNTVHAHPTLSESIMEAAADAYGEAIHI